MDRWRSFWRQQTVDYRNAQLFFGFFTIGFGVAACLYAAAPGYVASQFALWDVRLGGSAAGYPEPQCRIWISLAAANVATLSLMCLLLTRDFRRNAPMLKPLLFMKATSAALFVLWWLAMPGQRFLLIAAAGDFLTGGGIWSFGRRALSAPPDASEISLGSIMASSPSGSKSLQG